MNNFQVLYVMGCLLLLVAVIMQSTIGADSGTSLLGVVGIITMVIAFTVDE